MQVNNETYMPTLYEAFENYLEGRKDLRPSTVLTYKETIKMAGPFQKIPIDQIKYSDIKRLYLHLRYDEEYKASTIELLNNLLVPSFNLAVRDDIIPKNPAQGVFRDVAKGPSWKSHRKSAVPLDSQKEFLSFISSSPIFKRWENFFIFMFGTGLRIGEAIALCWEDVDFKNKKIQIRRNMYYRSGKYYEGPPKSEAGFRTIPMLPEVGRALARENQIARLTKAKVDGIIPGRKGYVFLSSRGTMLYASTVNSTIHSIVKEYNKSHPDTPIAKFSAHQIRHSFCSRLCEQDVNLKVVQTVMGHSNFETTMDVYTEVSEEKKQIVFDGLEGKIVSLG